jgi:hypothetical protein
MKQLRFWYVLWMVGVALSASSSAFCAESEQTIVYLRGVRVQSPKLELRGLEIFLSNQLVFKVRNPALEKSDMSSKSPIEKILYFAGSAVDQAIEEGKTPPEIREAFVAAFREKKSQLEAQGVEIPYVLDLERDQRPDEIELKRLRTEDSEPVYTRISIPVERQPPRPTPAEMAESIYRELEDTLTHPGLHLWGDGYRDWIKPQDMLKVLRTIKDIQDGVIVPQLRRSPRSGALMLDHEGRAEYRSVEIPEGGRLNSLFVADLMHARESDADKQ